MKKKILIALMMVLVLSACSEVQIEPATQNQENVSNNGQIAEENLSDENVEIPAEVQELEMVQLSTQMRLILGSLALDENNLSLSSDQAGTLIPLWKVLKTLLTSDTAAGAEIEALLNQINGELTAEQRDLINNYSVSKENYQEILNKFVPEEFMNTATMLTDEEREEKRATAIAENGGTIPQELQGSGGGRGMGGGSGIPRSTTGETTGSGPGAGAGAGQINTFLIDGLVAKLELLLNP
jgi:PBP1b-binding outer membrane lipoprotein LpoB